MEYNKGRNQTCDWEQENLPPDRNFDEGGDLGEPFQRPNVVQNYERDRKSSDSGEGWRGNDGDHSPLGSIGVSGYDSEFRSGRGSFYDRDTDYEQGRQAESSDNSTFNWPAKWHFDWTNSTPIEERGEHYGRGPQGYSRSDERIHDDINDHLTLHSYIDASNISVSVEKAVVTLEGSVPDRDQKRYAEELAERVHGVNDVQNNLRVQKP